MNINNTAREVHSNAIRKGWWDGQRNTGELLALVHSEVSEALEDYRDDKMKTYFQDNGKPCGFPSELADIVIRVLDFAESMGINIEREIELKMAYNQTRAYRHGGKTA